MKSRNFFLFVIRELIVVSGSTALATFAMMFCLADDNLTTRFLAGLYTAAVMAAISPVFSALPILSGALLLRAAAEFRPERFRDSSLLCGLLAAYLVYLELRLREAVGPLTEMDSPSGFLVALALVPSLVAWSSLAKKYLR